MTALVARLQACRCHAVRTAKPVTTVLHQIQLGQQGARPGPGKEQNLEFVSKSGQLYRAYLGDGCLAREFYAGAYMEKSLDGRLCEGRDLVHARTGAKCEIDKFKRLVASAQ